MACSVCGEQSAYKSGKCYKHLVEARLAKASEKRVRMVEWRARYKLGNELTSRRKLCQM